MKISIIIPVYNEEESIVGLLNYLNFHSDSSNVEILVVDGNSSDHTVDKVRHAGFRCITSEKKGRAAQMNKGAICSSGEVLYFVHADSIPPKTFMRDILNAVDRGYKAGCYRFKFDSGHPLLKINAFFTRFNRLMCRGGDQTLFITRKLFEQLGGFNPEYHIMEDFDMIERIQAREKFKIIPKEVIVSARKYKDNNYFKVNIANLIVFMMYFWGVSQEKMVNIYKSLINQTKFG